MASRYICEICAVFERDDGRFYGAVNGLCSVCDIMLSTMIGTSPRNRAQTCKMLRDVPEVSPVLIAIRAAKNAVEEWAVGPQSKDKMFGPVIDPLLKSTPAVRMVLRGMQRNTAFTGDGLALAAALNTVPGLLSTAQAEEILRMVREHDSDFRLANEHVALFSVVDRWRSSAGGGSKCYHEDFADRGFWEWRGGYHATMLERRVWLLERTYGGKHFLEDH